MGGKKDYEVLIEIGHKSAPLKKPAPNGYTHKWTVYLKGANDAKIEHCISHVVFQLHESFDNPHRVLHDPPYQVKETGYAGFELPIEVYFKNRDKPNHIVYVHNLELLTWEPHVASHVEKVMFLNPNKEFEKCLIRTGAQVHASKSKDKKDRGGSPPVKKRKPTSSPAQTNGHHSHGTNNHNHPSSNNNHSSSKEKKSNSSPVLSNGHHSNSTSGHNHSSHSNRSSSKEKKSASSLIPSKDMGKLNLQNTTNSQNHSSSSPQQANKPPGQSMKFVDLFGAPINYNKNTNQHHSSNNNSSQHHHHHNHSHNHNHHHRSTKAEPKSANPQRQVSLTPNNATQSSQSSQTSNVPTDSFHTMQAKIGALTDCDRLQQIVDIIVESGEQFNLTSKKFEFDLKRLDKKTLHKIEKCLH